MSEGSRRASKVRIRMCSLNESTDCRLHLCLSVLSATDIVAMPVCKFNKDRDDQARCKFERVLSMNVRIVHYIFAFFAMSTAGILTMNVRHFQKDRVEQARCDLFLRYSNDIFVAETVARKVCQLESLVLPIANVSLARSQFGAKQARCGFKSCSLICIWCGRRKLITAIQNFTILHTSYRRRSLLIAIQFVTHCLGAGGCLQPCRL